jgi:hypothetical protein
MAQLGAANVVLMGNNLTLSFDDMEASFGKSRIPYNHLTYPGYQLPVVDATSFETFCSHGLTLLNPVLILTFFVTC